jgi:hypothetical protein
MAAQHTYEQTTAGDSSPLSYTILWSPLPPITWLLPFIGHMGIATSKGVACDFQGPYSVGERGRMVSCRLMFALGEMHKTILCYSFVTSRHLANQREHCGLTQVLCQVKFDDLLLQLLIKLFTFLLHLVCKTRRRSRTMGQSYSRSKL